SEVSGLLVLAVLSAEDRRRVTVDLLQEVIDVRRRRELLVAVEAEVTVAPVQRPRPVCLRVTEPGDGEPCPFRPGALAPGRPALHDRQVAGGNVAFDTDLVAGMRGDAFFAPATHAGYVQFGQIGHWVSLPGGG